MFDSLVVAVNAIFPICLMIGLGYLLKMKKMLSKSSLKEMNKVVFKILIPLSLMQSMITTDLKEVSDIKFILFTIIAILAMIVCSMFVVRMVTKDPAKQGVMVQGLYRTNYVLLGLPICEALCGAENLGLASLMVSIVVPFYNFLAVLILQHYANKSSSLWKTFIEILKNPMISACLIGVCIRLIGIPYTGFFKATVSKLAACGTPVALVVLGGLFEFKSFKKNFKEVAFVVIGKLIVYPAIILAIAIFMFNIKDVPLVILLVILAGPVAVSSAPMADIMGLDGDLAGEIVFSTSLACLITLFCWIVILKQFMLI